MITPDPDSSVTPEQKRILLLCYMMYIHHAGVNRREELSDDAYFYSEFKTVTVKRYQRCIITGA